MIFNVRSGVNRGGSIDDEFDDFITKSRKVFFLNGTSASSPRNPKRSFEPLEKLLRFVVCERAAERKIEGTGNEGSTAEFLYKRVGFLLPLGLYSESSLGEFSMSHFTRCNPS